MNGQIFLRDQFRHFFIGDGSCDSLGGRRLGGLLSSGLLGSGLLSGGFGRYRGGRVFCGCGFIFIGSVLRVLGGGT